MSTAVRSWATGFYWIGAAMALASLAFVVASNTEILWRLEHTGFPLSWLLAGGAILAFLAFELCDCSSSLPREAGDRGSQLSPVAPSSPYSACGSPIGEWRGW